MTAATAQRWWTPNEPGIGPDEFDLRLLEAGGEPDKDFGQHLLAVHRIGAAACEAVATQPLADEVTLRGVLATARQMLAEPVTTAVSKAFDAPTYGAMLLADVLDDAEQAVISIYRTCITKNVAPSIAAHRAGLIYGVPLRELGRYTMLATDPKADKVAVEELADRTLFTFVSKTVAEEAPTGGKELVSKAPEDERERVRPRLANPLQALFDQAESRYLDEHNVENDAATGRFVRERTETTTAPATPAVRREIKRREVGRRQIKRREIVREDASQRTGQSQRGEMARGRMARGREKRGKLTRAQQRLQEILPELVIPPTTVGTMRVAHPQEEYLSRVEDRNQDADYGQLWTELSFVFPADEWNDRRRGMARVSDEEGGESLLFRARALEGGGPYANDDTGHLSSEHHNAREYVAGLIGQRPEHKDQPPPIVTTIQGAAHSIHDARSLTIEKQDFLRQVEDHIGRRLNMATEISFVHAAASHDDPDDLVLVWQPPTPGREPLDRPIKVVTEVYIEEDSALGRSDQTRYGSDITLDPNQPLQAIGGRLLWRDDGKGGFFIRQVDVVQADEAALLMAHKERERKRKRGFGKRLVAKAADERTAERLSQLQAMFDRAEDYYGADPGERNMQTGEFQRAGAQVAGRQRRNIARRNVTRREIPRAHLQSSERAQLATGQMARGQMATGQMTRAQLQEAAEASAKGVDEQTVFLDQGFDYTVLDREQLTFLLKDSGLRSLDDAYAETFRPGLSSTAMITDKWRAGGPDKARMALLTEAELRFRDTDSAGWKQLGKPHVITTDKDIPAIAFDIEDQLGRNPKVQILRSVINRRGEQYVITIHGNADDMGDGHLVRMELASGQGPIELRPEGTRRLTNARGIEHWLMVRFHGGKRIGATGSTDFLPVPLVHTWAVQDHYDAP